jgi:CRISPR-associated protein Cmr6
MPDLRFTLPGTRLPAHASLPPTLLFHRWQAYDRYEREPELDRDGRQRRDPKTRELKWLDAFDQNDAKLPFLRKVADAVQRECSQLYPAWNDRFSGAFTRLAIEPVLRATTQWRLVAGWGTNPTFETGLTLDHLLGFPFIPGSAVKGLLHRMAELELLEDRGGEPAIPPAPGAFPAEPPSGLRAALIRARRVRALFGSLHLRRRKKEKETDPEDPEAPYDRLAAWRDLLSGTDEVPKDWTETRRQLVRLCSDAPAGGMVACFDAVPDRNAFADKDRRVLSPDVLTPHEPAPNPIPFLAVQPGVTFELRYRLARWPATDPRDPEERERAADLDGITREAVSKELRRWLVRGLAELGLGGKTSAGYGYLLEKGTRFARPELLAEPPRPVEPREILPEPERQARLALPQDINASRAVDALDKALKEGDPAVQAAVAARFKKLFPETVEKWRSSQRAATRKRVEAIDRLLRGSEEPEP